MLRPLKDRVLVRQAPKKDKLGSLYIPNNAKELYDDFGVVEAIGSEVKIDIKVGDKVLFGRQPGSHVGEHLEEFKDLLMLKEEFIWAVVTDDTNEP